VEAKFATTEIDVWKFLKNGFKKSRKEIKDLRSDAFGEWPSFHGRLELHVLNLLLEHILIHLC
jgi:hypothetical protein